MNLSIIIISISQMQLVNYHMQKINIRHDVGRSIYVSCLPGLFLGYETSHAR